MCFKRKRRENRSKYVLPEAISTDEILHSNVGIRINDPVETAKRRFERRLLRPAYKWIIFIKVSIYKLQLRFLFLNSIISQHFHVFRNIFLTFKYRITNEVLKAKEFF